jgi:pyruvate/2-oxoglutarate/acetoin dehydrogenase E1 component
MDSVLSYKQALTEAMTMLARRADTLFVGQGVKYRCHGMFDTLEGVPEDRRIEFPVAEDFQAGFCIGLALEGYLPICIYPRWDFALLAANQIVNHLDKLPTFGWKPHVIIRVAVGHTKPLNPGPQHSQDHTDAFASMCHNLVVVRAQNPVQVHGFYSMAASSRLSYIIVEMPQ